MSDELEMMLRIVVALILGGIIGYQREKVQKPAGVRTLAIIAGGSALITVVSVFGFGADQARVAAGIITGIGFLGAGAIVRRNETAVEGLTTAATIWVAAGIGLAVGAGFYLIAAVTTVLVLLVLMLARFGI